MVFVVIEDCERMGDGRWEEVEMEEGMKGGDGEGMVWWEKMGVVVRD